MLSICVCWLYCAMTMGKGGQTANVSFTGVLSLQRSRRSRRRGDPRTMVRHFHTRAPAYAMPVIWAMASLLLLLLLLLEPDSHSNRIFLRGQRRGACHPAYIAPISNSCRVICKRYMKHTSSCISRPLPSLTMCTLFRQRAFQTAIYLGRMTQGGREMMADRWRGILERVDDGVAPGQGYRDSLVTSVFR
jgi:hypothetical protein